MLHLEHREALDGMTDQMEICGPGQVQIDGFGAGRAVVPKEGPPEAASPMGYHKLCLFWHRYQGLNKTMQAMLIQSQLLECLAKTNQLKWTV